MITSKENTIVKSIKALEKKKYREMQREYVIEGYKMVKEAIECNQEIRMAIYCEEIWNASNEEKQYLEKYVHKIETVSENIFRYLSDTVTPQGILAVIKEKELATKELSNIIFALDDIRDPGNLGTIIRTLDAAGYNDLFLSEETAEIYNPKVVRSTMGAIFRMNFHRTENLKIELNELLEKGYKIIATSLDTETYYYDLNFEDKLVIIIGNEANGVKEEIIEMANKKVKIPMLGKTESLNAAIATSIIAYEGVRQKVASGKIL